jgi:hypothetical protein
MEFGEGSLHCVGFFKVAEGFGERSAFVWCEGALGTPLDCNSSVLPFSDRFWKRGY